MYACKKPYQKGHGIDFFAWAVKDHPKEIVWVVARADLGTRFDIDFEAAVAIYMNRRLYMKYLKFVIDTAKEPANILELNLFTVLGSVEGMAAVRARAIFFLKVIQPLRFFANYEALGFSPTDMSAPLHALRDFLDKAKEDGTILMSEALDIFADCLEGDALELYLQSCRNRKYRSRSEGGSQRPSRPQDS